MGLACDCMLRCALARLERGVVLRAAGALCSARAWVVPYGAGALAALLCFAVLYAKKEAFLDTPRLQCLFWSQALLCAAFGAAHARSLAQRTCALEDTQPQALTFYSARRLRDGGGAAGVIVVLTNAVDDDARHHHNHNHNHNHHNHNHNHNHNHAAAAAAADDENDGGNDDDDDGGGGGLIMMPIARRERVDAVDAHHAPYFAALLCVSRTLLCWLVLGPRLLLVVAAASASTTTTSSAWPPLNR